MTLVELAKLAVENYIKGGKIISPSQDLPDEFLNRQAGTFVTLEKNGQLRGCIGTYLPTRKNIAEEIIYNAIAAATEDYRFGPIRERELGFLTYTVYILNKPELVKDIKELNPQKFGIIVKSQPFFFSEKSNKQIGEEAMFDGVMPYKCGLLLPDLEGVDTAEEQIAIACQKGGIDPQRENFVIYRFTAEKFTQNEDLQFYGRGAS